MPAKPEQSPLMEAILDVLNCGYTVAHCAETPGEYWTPSGRFTRRRSRSPARNSGALPVAESRNTSKSRTEQRFAAPILNANATSSTKPRQSAPLRRGTIPINP